MEQASASAPTPRGFTQRESLQSKPLSLLVFYENMVNELLLAASVSLNRVSAYKKRLGGHIVYFKEKAIAKHFSNTFPRTLLVGTKVHMFDVIEILTFH